MHDAYLAVTT